MDLSHLLQSELEEKSDMHSEEYVEVLDETITSRDLRTDQEVAWSRTSSRNNFKRYCYRLFRASTPRPSTHSLRKRKCAWRILTKTILTSTIIFVLLSFFHGIFHPSYSDPPERYQTLKDRVVNSTSPGRGNIRNERVFIAANILNEDLIRGNWGRSLLSLVELLGHENVFVSIYENDSGSGTRDALRELQQQMFCNSSIVTGAHVPLSIFPTVRIPSGQERVPRLAYLAEMRNRLLRPLDPSYAKSSDPGFRSVSDVKFDKILFLNDVYFSPLDALQLLFSTNAESGEAQYRAACALDFVQLFKLYDSFVVRDTDGYQLSLQYYPWFTHIGSGDSRSDVLKQSDAVRVRSCWGGMAAFNATLFQPEEEQAISPLKNQLPSTQTSNSSEIGLPGLPIQFRDSGEVFWEAAECCLIFADLENEHGKPSADSGSGVFINPYIRTAYSSVTWRWLPFFTRYERMTEYFQHLAGMLKHPEHNSRRLHEPGEMVDEIAWIDAKRDGMSEAQLDLRSRVVKTPRSTSGESGHFDVVHRKAQPGGFCGVRRLFVMKQDVAAANKRGTGKNWENIAFPWGSIIPS